MKKMKQKIRNGTEKIQFQLDGHQIKKIQIKWVQGKKIKKDQEDTVIIEEEMEEIIKIYNISKASLLDQLVGL